MDEINNNLRNLRDIVVRRADLRELGILLVAGMLLGKYDHLGPSGAAELACEIYSETIKHIKAKGGV